LSRVTDKQCKFSRKIDDIFGALDVVIPDCRIEITEAQASADERHDRQARALILSDITFAVGFRRPPRIEADEEIETFETDRKLLWPSVPLARGLKTMRKKRKITHY
jgi:hypothetical protein